MAYTTINDPTKYFNNILYSPGGATSVVGAGFQPDLVWIKSRTNATNHNMYDSSRGQTKRLYPNEEDPEDTVSSVTLDSDGFSFGAPGSSGVGDINVTGKTYTSWNWKCNGGTKETAVSESGNNPAHQRQTNTTAGFSIITSTGTGGAGTIQHGLGAVPHFIISKGRSNSGGWVVYHHKNTSAPETDALNLSSNAATSDSAVWFNDTAPTSSVFTLGTTNDVNGDARTYVHYVFTPIQGYSKFGGYTGNGNANGNFVYLGFKPAWLMIKRTGGTESWFMIDDAREPYNPLGTASVLQANVTAVETTGTDKYLDFLSNGFKCRAVTGYHNDPNEDYIYAAFAESPFVTSNGSPTNAR